MLLQALYEYSERNRLADGLAFDNHEVRWIIPINLQGEMQGDGLIDLSTREAKKGKTFPCPVTIRPKNAGVIAEFLADGITSLFGVESNPESADQVTGDKKNHAKMFDYWRQIEDAFRETQSPLLRAMLDWNEKYLTQDGVSQLIRWGAKSEGEKDKWWAKTGSGEAALGPGDYFTFQVDGRIVLDDEILHRHWTSFSQKERADQDQKAARGLCMISGNTDAPVMRSHPKIYLKGGGGMGAYMISFSSSKKSDTCSYSSFGWEKGENAPISTKAAEAYAAALNELISNKKHHIFIMPATLCFWTRQNPEYSDMLSQILNEPTVESVNSFFQRWKAGLESPLRDQDHFYSLMLSGNAGRIVVRRWIDQPLADASSHLERWFNDLRIEEIAVSAPKPAQNKKKDKEEAQGTALPYSVFRLACTTVGDSKDLITEVPVRLFTAALEGAPLPLSWLKPILHRFKCDLVKRGEPGVFPFNPSRFALLKLILIRNRKGDTFMPEVQLSETLDKPYNLGRLMAVLEYLQDKANEFKLEGAGVVDKYYASASAAPVTVFPVLLRLCRHHLKKLEKTEGGKGAAYFIEKNMQDIMALIQSNTPDQPPKFPRVLSLEEQGRFALGFYQQKAYDAARRQERKENNASKTENQ